MFLAPGVRESLCVEPRDHSVNSRCIHRGNEVELNTGGVVLEERCRVRATVGGWKPDDIIPRALWVSGTPALPGKGLVADRWRIEADTVVGEGVVWAPKIGRA